MPAHLLSLSEGPSILLDKPIMLVGRHEECDLQLNSRKVSRKHCCIAQVKDYLIIRDLGSTNGIRMNGRQVQAAPLRHGDRFEIGAQTFQIVIEEHDESPDTYELTPVLGHAISSRTLPRLGPIVPLAVLGVRLGCSLRSINRQQMPRVRGLGKLAVAGAVAAISAVDAVGAVAGGLRLVDGKPDVSLSYHGNDDRLAA